MTQKQLAGLHTERYFIHMLSVPPLLLLFVTGSTRSSSRLPSGLCSAPSCSCCLKLRWWRGRAA
jgi:hypothetical protein